MIEIPFWWHVIAVFGTGFIFGGGGWYLHNRMSPPPFVFRPPRRPRRRERGVAAPRSRE
jgi:hypothetical protein